MTVAIRKAAFAEDHAPDVDILMMAFLAEDDDDVEERQPKPGRSDIRFVPVDFPKRNVI